MIRPNDRLMQPVRAEARTPARLLKGVELLCAGERAVTDALGVGRRELLEIRHGTRELSLTESLTVVRLLRERAALLQLAAERAAEAIQSDVARVACDAYERAMQEPDKERAVEVALQVLFDVCA
jgi:hypothetical protein